MAVPKSRSGDRLLVSAKGAGSVRAVAVRAGGTGVEDDLAMVRPRCVVHWVAEHVMVDVRSAIDMAEDHVFAMQTMIPNAGV